MCVWWLCVCTCSVCVGSVHAMFVCVWGGVHAMFVCIVCVCVGGVCIVCVCWGRCALHTRPTHTQSAHPPHTHTACRHYTPHGLHTIHNVCGMCVCVYEPCLRVCVCGGDVHAVVCECVCVCGMHTVFVCVCVGVSAYVWGCLHAVWCARRFCVRFCVCVVCCVWVCVWSGGGCARRVCVVCTPFVCVWCAVFWCVCGVEGGVHAVCVCVCTCVGGVHAVCGVCLVCVGRGEGVCSRVACV